MTGDFFGPGAKVASGNGAFERAPLAEWSWQVNANG